MSKPPLERNGVLLEAKGSPIEFSYFPTVTGRRRDRVQTKVFTTDAWSIIHAETRQTKPARVRDSAIAFAEQAEEFYAALAGATTLRAKPLLAYYCFMNLTKALCLVQGNEAVVGQAQHGLSDRAKPKTSLKSARLQSFPSVSGKPPQVFDEFREAIGEPRSTQTSRFRVHDLVACSLVGHRLWCSATNRNDRFYRIEPEIMHDSDSKAVWMRAWMDRGRPQATGLSFREIVQRGFDGQWRQVTPKNQSPDQHHGQLLFEESTTTSYTGRPTDVLAKMASRARSLYYRSMRISDPFRVYYVYVPPKRFRKHQQLVARYALIYFLGSVTRYRPADFDSAMVGEFGPFLSEFLASEPGQMLFEMASLFARREIVSVGLA